MYLPNSEANQYDEELGVGLNEGNSVIKTHSPLNIRMGFIRKVFGLLCVQLLATSAIIGGFMTLGPETLQRIQLPLLFLLVPATFGILCVTCCFQGLLRKHPLNLVLLGIYTVIQSLFAALVCVNYSISAVLGSALITALITGALFAFACQTSYDFTSWVFAMFYIFIGFTVLSLVILLVLPASAILQQLFLTAGLMIFMAYLVIDIQLILGRGVHALTIDDSVLGAMLLYSDIINIFIYVLELTQSRN